jgi:hypothetical protein
VLLLLSVACGSDPLGGANLPAPSPPPDVTGDWSGQVEESGGGTAALSLSLVQQEHAVTGSFTLALPDGTTSGTGQISGSITGTKLEFNFVSPASSCPATAEVGPSTMSGGFLCSGVSAQFRLTRQAQ